MLQSHDSRECIDQTKIGIAIFVNSLGIACMVTEELMSLVQNDSAETYLREKMYHKIVIM